MFQKKNRSNLLFFIAVCIIMMIFFLEKSTYDDQNQDENIQANDSSLPNRDPASNITNANIDSNATTTPFYGTNTLDSNQSDFAFVHKNDPINNILKKFGMNDPSSRYTYAVGEDKWFVSKNLVVLLPSQNAEDFGEIINDPSENSGLQVVKLFNPDKFQKNFPPLVISHSTNQPVPITGELMIKYESGTDIQSLISFVYGFGNVKTVSRGLDNSLDEVQRVLIGPQNKNQVMKLYQELSSHKGNSGIISVEFDIRPQLKTI